MTASPARPVQMTRPNVPVLRVVSHEDEVVYPRCSLWLRGLARFVDLVIAWGLHVVGSDAGAVMALLFLLFSDGLLQNGQSIGKRLCGIRVVHLPTRGGARARESILRNAPFGLVVLLSMMPEPLGVIASAAGALLVAVFEVSRVLRQPEGRRLGDLWADTQVVDGKIPIAGALTHASGTAMRAPGRMMTSAGAGDASSGLRRSSTCG